MGSFLSIHPPEVCSEWRKIPKCQSMFGLAQRHIVLLCDGHNTARAGAEAGGGHCSLHSWTHLALIELYAGNEAPQWVTLRSFSGHYSPHSATTLTSQPAPHHTWQGYHTLSF